MVMVVTLEETLLEWTLVEQVQGENASNYSSGASVEEIRAEGAVDLLEGMLEASTETNESQELVMVVRCTPMAVLHADPS